MGETHIDQVAALLCEAAEKLDNHGSFRLRVLMQMLALEVEKARAEGTAAERPSPVGGSAP